MKARFEFISDEFYNKYLQTYFAGLAMQGILASYHSAQTQDAKVIARASMIISDALVNEINKQP